MKLAILADIHGNLPALKAVLKEIEKENIEKFLVAGDILGGPYPVEVIKILRDLKAVMIQGNFEGYLIKIYSNPSDSDWYKSKQWAPTYWVYKKLNQYWLKIIDALPKQRVISLENTDDILMVHSIHQEMLPVDDSGVLITDRYDEILETFTRSMEQRALIFAHNHISYHKEFNGCLTLNPGSVGCPLNGTVGAQYAIMNWNRDHWNAEVRTVDYDIDEIINSFVKTGYLKEGGPLARITLECIHTGKAHMGFFFEFLHELAEKQGLHDFEIFPDEILELADKKWDWNNF